MANKRCIQWAMFANENAVLGSYVLTLGGIVSIVGGVVASFPLWLPFGIYACIIGLLVGLVEYPRGSKTKGNTLKRSFQDIFTTFNLQIYPFSRNFYARSVCWFLVGLPAGAIVPTFLGAVLLIFASIVYTVAAVKGEQWIPIHVRAPMPSKTKDETIDNPPNKPPPRLAIQETSHSPYRAAPLPPSHV